MKSSEIRKAFIDYFIAKGHKALPSSSLVPTNDPTLLFTNAGMVQFKEKFLREAPSPSATTVQACIRAGGKHNDLENVGYTARHHTFFEMLGNFSFGEYFKREAIFYAWEFLTQVLQLPPEKLWVTVYVDDDEAADIWLKEVGVSKNRFSRCKEDNFWSMGDTGPCGPCTEIFYDHGPKIPGGPPGSPESEGDRYVEIWNLVFMQFNRDEKGQLEALPRPSVDTGMGLERIAAVVQGVHNNYDIDSFQRLIKAILAEAPPGLDSSLPSLKVIADHIRACSFLIAEGIRPGNEGRAYVLRRIVRRALRHGNKLGLPSPFFSKLVAPLVAIMGEAYPLLLKAEEQIAAVLLQEEGQFAKTLEQGLEILQEELKGLKGTSIPGALAFKLYDTYGFPLDLTEDLAREQGLSVDVAGFQAAMQQQRELSQAKGQFTANYATELSLQEVSTFHGYEKTKLQTKVSALLVEGKKVETVSPGQSAAVILEDTPFYAESGGQVGDKGQLQAEGLLFQVNDTKKTNSAIVHYGELLSGKLHLGQTLSAEIDETRRAAIRLNHTATHLLHAALKKTLGSHVQQKGSLVDAERARFDFSHSEALSKEQLKQLEDLVNLKIRQNEPLVTDIMGLEAAKKSGAVALFGEKYAEENVRVLSIGDFSKELCGGTHATRTGDIGLFKILAEYGTASGIRRIEMATGAYACQYVQEQIGLLKALSEKLKTNPEQAVDKLQQVLQEAKQQEKELALSREKLALQSGSDVLQEVEKLDSGLNFLVKQLKSSDKALLRTTLDQLKGRLENAVIILYCFEEDKMNLLIGSSKNLIGQVPSAVELMKELCEKGGGREDMAQGGGPIPADFEEKIAAIRERLAKGTGA